MREVQLSIRPGNKHDRLPELPNFQSVNPSSDPGAPHGYFRWVKSCRHCNKHLEFLNVSLGFDVQQVWLFIRCSVQTFSKGTGFSSTIIFSGCHTVNHHCLEQVSTFLSSLAICAIYSSVVRNSRCHLSISSSYRV